MKQNTQELYGIGEVKTKIHFESTFLKKTDRLGKTLDTVTS